VHNHSASAAAEHAAAAAASNALVALRGARTAGLDGPSATASASRASASGASARGSSSASSSGKPTTTIDEDADHLEPLFVPGFGMVGVLSRRRAFWRRHLATLAFCVLLAMQLGAVFTWSNEASRLVGVDGEFELHAGPLPRHHCQRFSAALIFHKYPLSYLLLCLCCHC
jgi:hypothetical protein